MTDKEADLIVKRSQNFALLCMLILIIVTVVFLISYFSLPADKLTGNNNSETTSVYENTWINSPKA